METGVQFIDSLCIDQNTDSLSVHCPVMLKLLTACNDRRDTSIMTRLACTAQLILAQCCLQYNVDWFLMSNYSATTRLHCTCSHCQLAFLSTVTPQWDGSDKTAQLGLMKQLLWTGCHTYNNGIGNFSTKEWNLTRWISHCPIMSVKVLKELKELMPTIHSYSVKFWLEIIPAGVTRVSELPALADHW